VVADLRLRIARVDSEATSAGSGTVLRQLPPAGSQVMDSTGIALVLGVAPAPAGPAVAPRSAAARAGPARAGPAVASGRAATARAGPAPVGQAVAPESAAARAEPAPARQPLPWRLMARMLLVLSSWAALAALAMALRRPRRRPSARGKPESRQPQAEWPGLAAPPTSRPATASVARLEAKGAQPSSVSSPPVWGRKPQFTPPAAPAEVGTTPPSAGSPAPSSIELTTILGIGTTALELAGPLEAAPAVPLDAAPTILLLAGGEPPAFATRPGVGAAGGAQLPSVRAVLAGGMVATDALAALGASLNRCAAAEHVAAGAVAADELGPRILSAILNALEIPLVRVLANAWSRYDAFRAYLDPARCPPERITVVALAAHAMHARFRPVVELRIGGRLFTSLRADVGLAIALETSILWIQGGQFAELRPGKCTAWGGIRCADVTLLQRPAAALSLPRILRFGEGVRLGDVIGAGR